MSSEKLTHLIKNKIENSGGKISFAEFMALALYAPDLGYYNTQTPKFGKEGDFITAPEISPLFAQCVAEPFIQVLKKIPEGSILELGAGSGIFAKNILLALAAAKQLPEQYYILEISPALREQQKKLLSTCDETIFSRVVWINQHPENFSGVIFANELFDALSVHCFAIENGIKERCVAWENNQFVFISTEPTIELTKKITPLNLPEGYRSEINFTSEEKIQTIARSLKQGVFLIMDYGYGRNEYYHPDRSCGTLMCFYQHHRHDNPFVHVGLQDITAHVDFTSIAENATACGMSLLGYTTQAAFLMDCGLLEKPFSSLSEIERIHQTQGIKKLILPSEMGEIVKVMAVSKNFSDPLIGFRTHDRKRDL